MSLITVLDTLLIGPLKLIFEIIYAIANRILNNPGLAIVFLSLSMNVLVLPLYKRADAMQEEARDMEAKLHDGVAHIKKTFSGDERMMILQTYYQQNHYSPLSSLNGSVSLLLEIPFFMAAYQFLSHLEILNGVAFGPITDLGAPDGLLTIGSWTINILPFVMTLINVISSALFLKGHPLKTKIQLYAMAAFFLVFLYTSPSCLLLYWTLNNVFSLVKTVFYKLKNPEKVLRVLLAVAGIGVICFALFGYRTGTLTRRVLLALIGLAMLAPLLLRVMRNYLPDIRCTVKASFSQYIYGALFLTVLTGLLIPSTFIAASPQEFFSIQNFQHPTMFLVSSACLAAGTFLVWFGVFYWLANDNGKVFMTCLVWILCGLMLINYMFFGTNLGNLSATLRYDTGLNFTPNEKMINLAVMVIAVIGLLAVFTKLNRAVAMVLLTATIAIGGMSVVNIGTINRSVDELMQQNNAQSDQEASFQLSKNGKNVVVLMMDRALGEYIPYLFNEKPELVEQFAGFTYYDNTISYGGSTNYAAPALLGGYEYTPVELNKRDSELLKDKHNEALLVMPVIFQQNGYDVTVCDPPYANYRWIPDLSLYDDYPQIKAYITKGAFNEAYNMDYARNANHRNFFCFSIMKTIPLFAQRTIYDNGQYNRVAAYENENIYIDQQIEGLYKARGMSSTFMDPYNSLVNIRNMTKITDGETNTFLFFANETTHEPMLLQTPDYVPALNVNNTEYELKNAHRFTLNGRTLEMVEQWQITHYQANMAAMLQLGKWFDYLREQGVYDNTRIILVSDHGYNIRHLEELLMKGDDKACDVERYYPLLMVKDYGSQTFETDHTFMTNADVPTLAFSGLIERPLNPFTGKLINSDEKFAHEQFVILGWDWDVGINNGCTYMPTWWGSVKDDLWVKDNWTFYCKNAVLKDHAMPE